jgi:superfamily II DNA or RNA helicase
LSRLAAPPATIAEFDAFLEAQGLGHVRGLGAGVLAPFVPEPDRKAMRYVLGRQRFTDFATHEALRRFGYALAHAPRLRDQLPPLALQFLQQEAASVARARAEASERLHAPREPRLQALHQALLALRTAHPATLPPRPADMLRTAALVPDPALPGFRWHDERPWVGPNAGVPVIPDVALRLELPGASARCSVCGEGCVHTLAAVDTALALLREPLTEAQWQHLEDLRRPAWERTLRAIDQALKDVERDAPAVHVSWRLRVHRDDGVEVLPYVHRPNKKGGLSPGTRVSAARLREEHDAALGPQDRRVAELAARTFHHAGRALLKALAGHPRVVLDANPAASVRVELGRVGLLADDRGGTVALCAALDGAPLPDGYVKRLMEERSSGPPPFLFEEAARRLTVLELPDEVRATLQALARFGNHFPPESHAALVEKLSHLSARVPVAMPRSVMGEAVPPQTALVLRLQLMPAGTVRGELRIRPLPQSAAFLPAEGARDVHVRRDGKPLHAQRRFEDELQAANALRAALEPVTPQDGSPWHFFLPDAQTALRLLERLEALGDEKPELEWLGQPLSVLGTAQASALKVTLEKKRDWFGVKGGLSIRGERVSLAVLLDAARREERFVRVTEHGYLEVGEALRRSLKTLSDHAWRSTHGLEVGPSAADALQGLGEAGAVVDADATWRALAERIFAAKELRPRVPRALKATLRPYQAEGFAWLTRLASWGAGAVLADDMGLGKTVQALAVLLDRAKKGPALVVAPTSVGFNWVDEAARFAPTLRLRTWVESADRGESLRSLGPGDVLVVSHGLLARESVRLSQVRFATLVLDEAQALKNATTQRARAARALDAEFRFALTGTPLENHLGELWSLYRIVFPGLLGSWESFRDRFATPIEKKLDPTAAPALARVLQPFLLRRTKAQVAQELPSRTDLRVPVVLSPEEWQLYEDARLAALSELETPRHLLKEQQRRVQVLAALTRLRLLASHPRLYDRRSAVASSKLARLLELVDELRAQGQRALVFSQFTSHLALVREALDARGDPYLTLDGRTPRKERERRVAAFQAGQAPLFLISLKAGGTGLNLTAADNVIHLDPWWNPAVEDQASDRAHRIGQHRPVTVYRLVARGTIEEQILALHEDKRALVLNVLDGKDAAARLSTGELLSLLSRPAERALASFASPSEERH